MAKILEIGHSHYALRDELELEDLLCLLDLLRGVQEYGKEQPVFVGFGEPYRPLEEHQEKD